MVEPGAQENSVDHVNLEEVVKGVIEPVRSHLDGENRPGDCSGTCGFASFMAEHLILYTDINQPRSGVETKVVNTLWLYSAAMGMSTEEVAGQIERLRRDLEYPDVYKYVFQHTIVLARSGNQYIVVDPTFCQFMDPKTSLVQSIGVKPTGISINDPLVQELYINGYIPLTDESMRRYLELTTSQDHQSSIPKQVSVADLYDRTFVSEPDYSKQELDRWLFKKEDENC